MKVAHNLKFNLSVGFLISVLSLSGTVRAQSDVPPPPSGHEHGRRGPGLEGPIGFLGVEAGFGRKVITGAPFTASFTDNATQTLADGNVIQRSTNGMIARDSQGRTRRDVTLPAIGPLAPAGGTPPHIVLIEDTVAQKIYILDMDRKVAHQVPFPPGALGKWLGGGERTRGNDTKATSTPLGTQTVDGLNVSGTRTTRTIPAGAIGNLQPIQVTMERWNSSDLQIDTLVKRSDPRMGTTVFQLTNIQRQDPDPSLFQVPSDFTVEPDGPRGHHGRRGAGNPPPPPPN